MPATPIANPVSGESLVGIEPQLLQQVDPGWRGRLNLFTGRTLSKTSLDNEQQYRAGLLASLGQSVSAGIVTGLVVTVEGSPGDPILRITPGYGISALGEDVSLLTTMQTKLQTLAVIDPATGTAQQTFRDYASNPGSGVPAGILVLQPVTAQVNGQMFDTGAAPIVVSGNLEASCGQDPDQYAFEDWQTVDGARLVFVPWPLGVTNLLLPKLDPVSMWRNQLAYTIFNAEARMAADQQFPWAMPGVPIALLGFEPAGQLQWQPKVAFVTGQLITDSNGNLEVVQTAGTSDATEPNWQPPGKTAPDASVTWLNAGPGTWKANASYVVGQIVFDPQGNLQAVQTAGQSGSSEPLWNVTAGQTTKDNTVTWVNNGRSNWRKSTPYAAGQFIVDSNGNIQTVQKAGTSDTTAPEWQTTIGQTTPDANVVWVNSGMAWKLLFVDRSSVVRPGGLPRLHYALPADTPPLLTWQALTIYSVGQFILDSNGNIQNVQTAGQAGGTEPAWNVAPGQTTGPDGGVTWVNAGLGQWKSATAYNAGQIIIDSNGNLETVLSAGTSGTSEPDWSDTFLSTKDGTVVWVNNGTREPLMVQPGLAQARVSQLTEQINDLLSQPGIKALADFAHLLPPSGLLPVASVDLIQKKSNWFPVNWSLSGGPIRVEELETALLSGMTGEPLDITQAEEVELLVPLPDALYDPNILVQELVSPQFQNEIDKATKTRNDILHQRKAIQLELNALSTALGPNTPPPNPNLIDLVAGLTPSEIAGRDLAPNIFPRPNANSNLDQTFATIGPASWQPSQKYIVGQFVIDPNGNIQTVTTAGTSGASQPTWSPSPGSSTTDGATGSAVIWGNNGTGTWQPSTAYVAPQFIFDPNGNIQVVSQVQGDKTTGKSQFRWNPNKGQPTPDGQLTWSNQGAGTWQAKTQYNLDDMILDSNGNVQTVQTAGISGPNQPIWDTDSGQGTQDNTVFWVNCGQPTVWEPGTQYSKGEVIVDPSGNLQKTLNDGTTGATQMIWASAAGAATQDNNVQWKNLGPGTWLPNTKFAAGQFIFDSNGNIQTVQQPGTSGSSQPVWSTTFGQTTSDTNIVWIASQNWISKDLQTLQAQATTVYTLSYTDTSGKQTSIPLINNDDWSDLGAYGLQHFIDRLNAKIKKANDLIDLGFLNSQTDIYRFRQNVLGATEASRLATSPILANIATGETAAATATNLKDYIDSIRSQTPGTPPAGGGAPAASSGGAAPAAPTGLVARMRSMASLVHLNVGTQASAVNRRSITSFAGAASSFASAESAVRAANAAEVNIHSTGLAGVIAKIGQGSPTATFTGARITGVSVSDFANVIQRPGENVPAQPNDVQQQSPLPGAQLDIRTLSIAQRLALSPSQESLFYAINNRMALAQLLLDLEITIDDLQFLVDAPPADVWQPKKAYAMNQAVLDSNGNIEIAQNAGTSGANTPAWTTTVGQPTTDGPIKWINRGSAQAAVPVEPHYIWELRQDSTRQTMMTRIQTPFVASDSDEAGLFSVGIRVVEQHSQLLRALEGRVQLYVDFVTLCTNALNNIQSNIQAAQSALTQLENQLVLARQDMAFTNALLADEILRVAKVNDTRSQILLKSVQVIAYTRPRTLETEQDVPSRQLVPGQITNPVPACLQQSISIPPELREIVSLLHEAPVNWMPAIQALLSRLERVNVLQEIATAARARAAMQLQLPLHVSSANTEPGVYGPVISSIYTSHQQIFRGYQTQRASFQPAQLYTQSWSQQVASLANVIAIADLTATALVHAEVATATSRLIQQVSSVATCLYARASLVLPEDRLAWAEFLLGPGLTGHLQSLSILPKWDTQEYMDRQQMQLVVDWLFQQIDTTNDRAVAFMSDVVRVCILLASHAPVNDVIAGAVMLRTQPTLGGIVSLNLPSVRIASGMFVQLYAKGVLAADAVVSDFDSITVSATVTAVHTPGVYLESNDIAHFTTQQPVAAALRPFAV